VSEALVVSPLIADIKRHSLEDGPGIRSVVFFKGCPLRCTFCHNPEMQRADQEIAFRLRHCIGCAECVKACPKRAVSLGDAARIDRRACDLCGDCVARCPSSALAFVGRHYDVAELVQILLRDASYYRHSSGGVTLSGGECTMFRDYLEELVHALRREGQHILIETCGECDGDWFATRILPFIDMVYFDLKLADPDLHRELCGRDNRRILKNLDLFLRTARPRITVRVPLVPGITATPNNLAQVARLLAERELRGTTLLPYNPLGTRMARCLGRPEPALPQHGMTRAELDQASRDFERAQKA
jgi:pyruvate formate lyase activating enzyme